MKKLKSQLNTIAKSLATLSKQVEKITEQIDKLQPAKITPAKKILAKKKTPVKEMTVLDSVFNIINKSKKGVTIANLREKTGLNAKQLSNALYKLSKKGKIIAKERGLYIKK